MKKRNILLGIVGVFLLASCGTEKPYIRPNNDNVTPNGGVSNPGTVVPETPQQNGTKRYRYYEDCDYANPFVQDYTAAELFDKCNVRCSLTDEEVTNFADFSYTFACGTPGRSFNKTVTITSNTKVSEAFQMIEDKYNSEDFDRYFSIQMTDSSGISFSQTFFYDYYLPNFERGMNYPESCTDMQIPQFEGEKVQYYVYETNGSHGVPFGLRIYGFDIVELLAFYNKLEQEGFAKINHNGADDVVVVYDKVVDEENILHLEVVSACNSKNPLQQTFQYDIAGDVIVWPRLLRKAKTDSKVYELPEQLIQIDFPEFKSNGLEFVYKSGDVNYLFVYNIPIIDLNKYLNNLENIGFEMNYNNYNKEGFFSYDKYIERIGKTVKIVHITDSYCAYQIFTIELY